MVDAKPLGGGVAGALGKPAQVILSNHSRGTGSVRKTKFCVAPALAPSRARRIFDAGQKFRAVFLFGCASLGKGGQC